MASNKQNKSDLECSQFRSAWSNVILEKPYSVLLPPPPPSESRPLFEGYELTVRGDFTLQSRPADGESRRRAPTEHRGGREGTALLAPVPRSSGRRPPRQTDSLSLSRRDERRVSPAVVPRNRAEADRLEDEGEKIVQKS
jgi:hypothetical protein